MNPGGTTVPVSANVKRLADEIRRRFPEAKPAVLSADESSPHELLAGLIDWLLEVATPTVPPDVAQRIVDFDRWCMSEPRGTTAADDIPTIEFVTFREKLFRHDALLPLIARLMSREELLSNGKHLASSVGTDRYEAALRVARRAW